MSRNSQNLKKQFFIKSMERANRLAKYKDERNKAISKALKAKDEEGSEVLPDPVGGSVGEEMLPDPVEVNDGCENNN